MLRSFLLEEPELYFGGNKACLDPQIGILNFGPHGGFGGDLNKKISIMAGIVGTDRSIEAAKTFLERLRHRIDAEDSPNTEYRGIDFPGMNIESPLGFEILIDDNCTMKIDRKFIRSLSLVNSRKERIKQVVKEYVKRFDDLREAHPAPKVIFLPIDDELLTLCKDPHLKTNKIVYQRRDFGGTETIEDELFDFHNYLKAKAAIHGFVTQMILPQTLIFAEERQNAAFIGWNFSVGTYYKATGVPWKLADIDDETCYIGISFYHDIRVSNKTIRASIAQVYMRTGESQVISGRPFEWDEEQNGRNVRLTASQMEEIIRDSIQLFSNQRGRTPRRVVVHKSSRFSDDELEGCTKACEDVDELDIVHIMDRTKFRAYHAKHDYSVVRGMGLTDGQEAMLFTTGFISSLGTYPGATVPRPLHIVCQRLDTSMETVCRDILGLTKLDWNSSAFCTRIPVTIGVSRKVGAMMAEMVVVGVTPPTSYRYYM